MQLAVGRDLDNSAVHFDLELRQVLDVSVSLM